MQFTVTIHPNEVAYRELSSGARADYEREWLEELLAWFKKNTLHALHLAARRQ